MQVADHGAVRVVAPCVSDPVGGALHSAYGEQEELPKDWYRLLDSLDQID